jgi:energy-converting hydrogenase B subunit D
MMTGWFDIVLGLILCATAISVLVSQDLFRAIVMFIVFGLLMALVWVRLDAPDIALAEAAIGAGLTGVLLLDTLGYLRRRFTAPTKEVGEDAS